MARRPYTRCEHSATLRRSVAMELPDLLDATRPLVVQMTWALLSPTDEERRRWRANEAPSRGLGTGFLVNRDGIVVTAAHVIKQLESFREDHLGSDPVIGIGLAHPYTERRSAINLTRFDTVALDDRHDIALVRMRKNPFRGEIQSIAMPDDALRLAPDRPRDGAEIATLGYPLNEVVLVATRGCVASGWGIDLETLPDPVVRMIEPEDLDDLYLGDIRVNRGNSGGPVFRSTDGGVIGMVVSHLRARAEQPDGSEVRVDGHPVTYNAGLTGIVPAQYVCQLLDEHALGWSPAE